MTQGQLSQLEAWKIEAMDCLEAYAEGFNDATRGPDMDVAQALDDLRAGLFSYAERRHQINRLPLSEITQMIDRVKQRYDA